ncbi:hypothetical protein J7I98_38905 [Streptomyces sp. ISL-98]|uniref:hypothetical protein n=1 Tax=Streptomyces sp. ISL-98 TaxID=2819192 RepID=UPI001BE89F7D|nr:hypothetical protein [Streptomyces sp. ISL-98]MBT2511650.1 hypothetical protein [Streptomyces sp. ISL-98]
MLTEGGLELGATHVIAASGEFGNPHIPALPGLDGFSGAVLRSSAYSSRLGYVGLEYQHKNASASLRGVGRGA